MKYRILGKEYTIIDSIEYITLADSFVMNKIGTGHGEAKLYVGNYSDRLLDFFNHLDTESKEYNCFFLKTDFIKYLQDAEQEYKEPQQDYASKTLMPSKFGELLIEANSMSHDLLRFTLYRVDVEPPRVYMNSRSEYYRFMRLIGLPNISYLSILKLADKNEKIVYYFRAFVDYKSDIVSYKMPEEKVQEDEILNSEKFGAKKKKTLIDARKGQGKYREELLLDCPICPFTGVNDERLLIASHIKPWSKSNEKEKVDKDNGLIFTPTYDKLFDRGFITFNEDKTIEVSPWISPLNQKRLGIYTGKKIERINLTDARWTYLRYHRDNVYNG